MRPEDCVTVAQKVRYSLFVRAQWEALDDLEWEKPSDAMDLIDRYGDPQKYAWAHPEWADRWARAEGGRQRVMKALAEHERNMPTENKEE